MSAEVRKVLLRLRRRFRANETRSENNNAGGQAYAWSLAGDDVLRELQKLDKQKKRATKKLARTSR